MKFFPVIFSLLLLFILTACSFSKAHFDVSPDNPAKINNGIFQVTVKRLHSGKDYKDFFVQVEAQNFTSDRKVFDSAHFKLVAQPSGKEYFSISRDNDEAEIPENVRHVITSRSVRPGGILRGRLWIITGPGEANQQSLTLHYDRFTIEFRRD